VHHFGKLAGGNRGRILESVWLGREKEGDARRRGERETYPTRQEREQFVGQAAPFSKEAGGLPPRVNLHPPPTRQRDEGMFILGKGVSRGRGGNLSTAGAHPPFHRKGGRTPGLLATPRHEKSKKPASKGGHLQKGTLP